MDDTKVNPSSAMEHLYRQQGDSTEGGIVAEADSIQDQVIIAPEVMGHILELLDIQSLKQVRLVCKSWLREAGIHMKKKGIVRFNAWTIQEFAEAFQNQVPTLPQPFRSIQFNSKYMRDEAKGGHEMLVGQFASLCPPLEITRFIAKDISLDLVLALIIESSSSLEYLELLTRTCSKGDDAPPLMDGAQVFPKLRELHVDPHEETGGFVRFSMHFPAIVAWILQSSPHLETFKSWGHGDWGQWNETLLKLDLTNVKTLSLVHFDLNLAAFEHIRSIPFQRLDNLKMILGINNLDLFPVALDYQLLHVFATVANCAATLRILDLSEITFPDIFVEFPVCPHLQDLKLRALFDSHNWLPASFPALQVLTVNCVIVDVFGDSWMDLNPFLRLKTLKADKIALHDQEDYTVQEPLMFFQKFPALECLGTNFSLAAFICGLKATGDPRFLSLLEGVRDLEIAGPYFESGFDLAPLAVLKGVERITMVAGCIRSLLSLPYKIMPALKVIQFPWNWEEEGSYPMDQLSEMARAVERVVLTNCYGELLDRDSDNLEIFFESAPNVSWACRKCQRIAQREGL